MTAATPDWQKERLDKEFYAKDVDYPSGFIVDQMPLRLSYVAALRGFAVPNPAEAFTYCELGCSTGITLNTLAAANPQAKFYGVDFNSESISKARHAAQEAGLNNVEYLAQSFGNLVPEDFPEFDYVTMQGTYSWLPPGSVESVIRFLGKALKPGGLFYVEFMLLPALAATEPVARLMRELTAHIPGDSLARAEYALDKLIAFCQQNAEFFVRNPKAANAVASWVKEREINPHWAENIAHAQLSGSWTPKYVTDVSEELSAAGLRRVGSTILPFNDIKFSVPPGQLPMLAGIDDALQIELVIDYLQNRESRQDVFIKDVSENPAAAREFLHKQISLLPRHPTAEINLSVNIPGRGAVSLQGPVYNQIIKSIEWGGIRIGDLLEHSIVAGMPGDVVFTAITHLVASENFFLCQKPCINIDVLEESTTLSVPIPYNRYVLDQQSSQLRAATLACPVTGGGGVTLPALEALLLRLWIDGGQQGIVQRALDELRKSAGVVQVTKKQVAAKDVSISLLCEALIRLKLRRGLNLVRLGAIEKVAG